MLYAFEGESNPPIIQRNVQTAIGGNMSLFCLGFGNHVQYSFLDVMARQNKGLARRIFEGSDAALQLQVEKISIYKYTVKLKESVCCVNDACGLLPGLL